MSTKTAQRVAETHQRLVDELVKRIEEDPGTWRKPWVDAMSVGAPTNPVSGAAFTGGNRLILGLLGMIGDYVSPGWATYRQWASVDCQVRKGETAIHVLRPIIKKVEKDDGTEGSKLVAFTTYPVFNADQVDGGPAFFESVHPCPNLGTDPIPEASAWFDRIGADIRTDGARAFFTPGADYVAVPDVSQFHSPEGYYATLGHELTHWTGHKSRLARPVFTDGPIVFGSEPYALEELTAELGAVFLCADLGLSAPEDRDDHAPYLAHWLAVIKRKPSELYKAAGKADQACRYLHKLADAAE